VRALPSPVVGTHCRGLRAPFSMGAVRVYRPGCVSGERNMSDPIQRSSTAVRQQLQLSQAARSNSNSLKQHAATPTLSGSTQQLQLSQAARSNSNSLRQHAATPTLSGSTQQLQLSQAARSNSNSLRRQSQGASEISLRSGDCPWMHALTQSHPRPPTNTLSHHQGTLEVPLTCSRLPQSRQGLHEGPT
jgi:hypothetical protein